MNKSFRFCAFIILFTCFTNTACFGQKDKLFGHWSVVKIITEDTGPDGFEINLAFFEDMYFKKLWQKADAAGRVLNADDSLSIQKSAREVYEELKGTYFQLNPNGTIAASFEKGNEQKGKFTINEREHSITVRSGKTNDLWFYSIREEVLHLMTEDGSYQAFLKKD